MTTSAAEICRKAAEIVAGDRSRQHGDIRITHENIAHLWAAWLGVSVSATDVTAMMILLKLARTKGGEPNVDDYIDIGGYAGCMGEIKLAPKCPID